MVTAVNNLTSAYNASPIASQAYQPRQGAFYAIEQDQFSAISPPRPQHLRLFDWIFHPVETYQASRLLKTTPQERESYGVRVAMYRALRQNLSSTGRKSLLQQLKAGRLTDTQSDNNRSTLAQLYNMVSAPRAQGLDGKMILEETLRLLSQPQTITQKFASLDPASFQALLQYYRSSRAPKELKNSDIVSLMQKAYSATCVSSSVMYYMVKGSPSEFARHIAELTSPRMAFFEKAFSSEISPDDPSKAAQKLSEYGIPSAAAGGNGAQHWVKVDVPYSGLIRAISQGNQHQPGTRGVVESMYQDALTHLVERSYDPGTSTRIETDGSVVQMDGLAEDQKTLLESIVRDNGGVMPVTYQFTASGRDGEVYLLGYFRGFEQTTRDLVQSLDMGEPVIIGYVDTDNTGTTGRLNLKHEVLVTGYERDKKTGELLFTTADSDDDNPKLDKRSASELVPKIHHAAYNVRLSQRILKDVNVRMQNNQYLVPDARDTMNYRSIATVPPSQQRVFLEDYQKMAQETEEKAPSAEAQQQPNVSQVYPAPYAYRQPQVPYYAYPGNLYAARPYYSYYNYPASAYPYPTSYAPYNYYGNAWRIPA